MISQDDNLELRFRNCGLKLDKSFGQHFLLDQCILSDIVSFAGEISQKTILEVGAGAGSLTEQLLLSAASFVHTAEIDKRLLPLLQPLEEAYNNRLIVHNTDALKLQLHTLQPSPEVIIANLPYNIASKLIINWLSIPPEIRTLSKISVLVQKEVAQRLAATPENRKAYGTISVLANALADVFLGGEVSPECFLPPPKVDSQMIRMELKSATSILLELSSGDDEIRIENAEKDNDEKFARYVKILTQTTKCAFSQRRKKLNTSLSSIVSNLSDRSAKDLLLNLDINGDLRADQLPVKDYQAIAVSLYHSSK